MTSHAYRSAPDGPPRQTRNSDKIAGAQAAFDNLLALFQQGENDACLKAGIRFTTTWPEISFGWQILAACCHAKGDHKNAEVAGRRALAIDDNSPDTHNIYGCTLKELGNLQGAGFHFGRAIELKPQNAEAHSNLGAVLVDLSRLDEAETMLRRAISLKPESALAHYQLGTILRDTDQPQEARRSFETALQHQPNLTAASIGLGHLMTHTGDFKSAEQYYRTAITHEPTSGALHYYLAFVKKFAASDPDLAAIGNLLENDGLPVSDKVYLHYAAAKAHDDAGNAFDAFNHFDSAAKLHRDQLKFDMGQIEAEFSLVEHLFTDEMMKERAVDSSSSAQQIFIVGMPRSGTTLVEQILASHPNVHAMGERDDLARLTKSADALMTRPFPYWIADVDADQLARLSRKYISSIRAGAPKHAHVTDKMLTNFKLLGLISMIMPDAKVVHVRREPLDCCLSCYCQPFTSGSLFSYNLTELGRYYQGYHRLMTHWQQVLPDEFLMTIDYEDIVQNPVDSSRAIIDHCGLEWDDSCLDFQNTNRQVRTASATQVRQKLYNTSIGRWKNYEAYLTPLIEALGPLSKGHAPRSSPVGQS
ncbi:MAG: tetratricopeptide repeat protein [Rhizobiales bacterium]|nr:tetratricopeptide repeat protein [Hyphomicrobiales bacterium]